MDSTLEQGIQQEPLWLVDAYDCYGLLTEKDLEDYQNSSTYAGTANIFPATKEMRDFFGQ